MRRVLMLLLALLMIGCAPDAPSTAADCENGTRFFNHDQLATDPLCIPEQPTRIVVLDPFTFEAMVAIDAPLVATPHIYVDELLAYSPQFEPALQDVSDAGLPVNFEALLEAQPDIILCRRTACDGQLRRLSQIAPTVVFDNQSAADWRESARFFADAVNMVDEIAAVEADYDNRTHAFRDELGDEPPTVSVMRVQPGRLRLYFEQSFSGIVLTDAGFTYPEEQAERADARRDDAGRPQLANISDEQLTLIEADYAFVYTTETTNGDSAQAYLEALQGQAIWGSLDVVERRDLHVVGIYWFASGYIAAHQILDDLAAIVLGENDDTVNPFE